jgi:pimeloyl-ACP methyl ester carboxylesterase
VSRPWSRRARFLRAELGRRLPRERSQALEDREASLSAELDGDSRSLLVAFGGIRGGQLGMPAFEFFQATARMPVKRVFVRDLRQGWYHRGIPEYGDTLASVAEGLRALIDAHEVDRLVMAGNSAGGYAALVFGTLLGAHTVLAFAPQTVLGLDELAAIDDHRWDEQLGAVASEGALDERWSDLRDALPLARLAETRYQIYFDDSLAVDRLHAERLRGLDGARLYRFGRGRHKLVRELREAGALERLLHEALGLDPSEPLSVS